MTWRESTANGVGRSSGENNKALRAGIVPARHLPPAQRQPNPLVNTASMDNSPTALFESYEQDFKTIIDSIREKLEVEAGAQKGGACVTVWTLCTGQDCRLVGSI